MKKYGNILIRLITAGLIIVALSSATFVNLITDYLWFNENGFTETFMTRIVTKVSIFIPLWIAMSLFLIWYLNLVKRSYVNSIGVGKTDALRVTIRRSIKWFSISLSGFAAYGIANSLWLNLLRFMNRVNFNEFDPIFGQDIGFYVFTLPFLKTVLGLLIFVTLLMMAITLIFHGILMTSFQNDKQVITIDKFIVHIKNELLRTAEKRAGYFAIVGFILLGIFFLLGQYELLYSSRGVAYGASFTDINVTLWAYRSYAVLSLVSAVLVVLAINKKKIQIAAIGPGLLVIATLGFGITGLVVQQLVVEPDEISKEKEYLEYNIEHTQKAFNLDDVSYIDFPSEDNVDLSVIDRNEETVKNIRINDYRPLKQTYNQIQGIRLYYDFNDIDLDRYLINGEYKQVFLSPRELDLNKLDSKAKTWLNSHIKYTHGHGVVMSPVNAVTDRGQPELYFSNIPPITTTDLVINQPEIYFGEQTNDYIVVNTEEKEFDYPSGSDNVETMYSGSAGIELTSFNKGLFAYRERSFKLLVSNNITPESRILIRRNIMERVKTIAPFLSYDDDPYIVINQEDGKLYWIIDAYTDSRFYPYSQGYIFKGKQVNYLRNSVKVVIDAYNGDTEFYLYDEEDPIVNAYKMIFGDLFKDKDDFPTGLAAHVRYPQDFFDIQSVVYRSYHVDNPVVFYNGEDVWDLANEKYMEDIQVIESNYVMFNVDEKAEFLLIVPYTPKGKPNMTSLLVARSDGDNYGEIFAYRYPKEKTVQGPIMIESRIDQDSVISPQFTLWSQEGSKVLRGNLIVVPIENSLLYVEPIYIQADNPNSLPEMKRVIVSYKEEIVMEKSLDEALAKLFGASQEGVEEIDRIESLLNNIDSRFDLTKETLEELESLIIELKDALEKE